MAAEEPPPEPRARGRGRVPKEDPEFPNISRMRELDREEHVRRAMEAGASREEAERHADEDLAERDDSHQ